MTRSPNTVRQTNPAEWRAFHTTCERLSGFSPVAEAEWVDGFLTALAAGPRLPEPQDWLPAMCDDAFERAFADPQDHAQALRSLQARLKVLCDQLDPGVLMDDPEALRLDPLMHEWTDADREKVVQEEGLAPEEATALQTGARWAHGFLHALDALPELWQPPQDEELAAYFDELTKRIAVLAVPPDDPVYGKHVSQFYPEGGIDREDLLAEAVYSAQDLRVLWADALPKPEPRRVQPAPGRNDPCPCGSGKKYKKCHGAAA